MKNYRILSASLSLLIAAGMISCGSDDDGVPQIPEVPEIPEIIVTPFPSTISIVETGLYPEGIDFNTKNNRFVVGSIKRSEVGYVEPLTGAYTTFIKDPNLASVTGVFVDESRDRLLVVSGNLGFSDNSSTNSSALAYLGIYNLETGTLIEGVNLKDLLPEEAGAFANDIAVDDNGNIYVTDSFSPVIYKVDGTTLESSIFVDGGDDFTPTPGAFGLNGIVFTNGNLIVSKTEDGSLFKVPVSNPEDFTKVDAPPFVGGDGLELDNNNNVVLVVNSLGEVPGTKLLSSNDDWASATLVSSFDVDIEKFPATATLANDGEIYVVNSYLGLALDGDLSQETFSIQKTN